MPEPSIVTRPSAHLRGPRRPVHFKPCSEANLVDAVEADVVSGAVVFRAGVAQTDDSEVVALAQPLTPLKGPHLRDS